ncbi:hypothetical protein EGT74_15375 [Chitinophaga lutea]|uniref:Uncharacterized protein n=1 Tax=Chitinophaga lutea TaxID=2488634 RepID=A0A3N4PLJ9_9BACT|nr:hypothetical protein EGT74_15375 [Chitinophaga lutea]
MACRFLSLFSLLLGGCAISCREYGDTIFRHKHCDFIITEKFRSEGRYINLAGVSAANRSDTFMEIGYYDLYDSAMIGDRLVKDSGKTEVILIRVDSFKIAFQYTCDGKLIE